MTVKLSDLITQKEAAEIRGVTPQSIYDLVKRGKFTTVTIGKRKFLLRSEVKKYKPSTGGRPRKKPVQKPHKGSTLK
jgi:excisionase family DNA binding protein